MNIILIILFGTYLIFSIMSLFGFLRPNKHLSIQKVTDTENQNLISIIVPFRNEANRIHELLSSLQKQSKTSVIKEIIFVDDHSTDRSSEVVEKWTHKSNYKTKIIALSEGEGKKHAIHFGVLYSTAPYVLLLDADVNFECDFMQKLADNNFSFNELILIPVVETSGLVWSRITSYVLSVITIGMARLNLPILANGAGLLFDRAAYLDSNPFSDNFDISSGDDLFLLEAFTRKYKVRAISPKSLFIETRGAISYREFIERSLRWSGKMKHIRLPLTNFFGSVVLLVNLSVVPIAILFILKFSILNLLLLSAKCIVDIMLLSAAIRHYKSHLLLLYTIPMLFLYPLSMLLVLFLNVFNYKNQWKNRLVLNSKS